MGRRKERKEETGKRKESKGETERLSERERWGRE
jgi:hypothetical protein